MGEVTQFRMKLTPRQRELLRIRLWVYADMLYDDVEEHGGEPVEPNEGWWSLADVLPPCTWNLDGEWRRNMARAFDDLAGDMETGALPYPRSIAEQLALRLAIDGAHTAMTDHDYDAATFDTLPHHRHDRDWEAVVDDLMEDRDVEAFYSTDPAVVSAFLSVLPIDIWFRTFPQHPGRADTRGHRR